MTGRRIYTLLAILLASTSLAGADTIMTFTPPDADMDDLDHYSIYMWGIDVDLAEGEFISAAELTFDNIRNWDNNPNDLFIHQLDWAELGVTEIRDHQGGGDYFANEYTGDYSPLTHYQNLPNTPQDITYTYSSADLAILSGYLADGRVGLGMDPDCHFYNDGVQLSLTVVPEPASMVLLAVGGLALVVLKR